MTEIIAAFPCLGKTTMSKRFPDKVLDLETSDYFFERVGFEKLTDEEFKGLSDRIPKKNGLNLYIKDLIINYKSKQYDFILTAMNPEVIKAVINSGFNITIVKPFACKTSEDVFRKRSLDRGNNEEWIDKTIKFIYQDIEDFLSEEELQSVKLIKVPASSTLSKLFYDK